MTTEIPGHRTKSRDVLREARTAISNACAQETGTDSGVAAKSFAYVFNVSSDSLTNVRDRVDERNLHRQKSIGSMFDNFSALGGRLYVRALAPYPVRPGHCARLFVIAPIDESSIELPQKFPGPLRVRANDNAVGIEEIGDSRALTQELRVGNHVKFSTATAVEDHRPVDPGIRIHRHRALFHDDLVAPGGMSNFARHRLHIRQISVAIGRGRGAYRDHNDQRLRYRIGQ